MGLFGAVCGGHWGFVSELWDRDSPLAKPGTWPEAGSPQKVGSVLGECTGEDAEEEAAAHPKG